MRTKMILVLLSVIIFQSAYVSGIDIKNIEYDQMLDGELSSVIDYLNDSEFNAAEEYIRASIESGIEVKPNQKLLVLLLANRKLIDESLVELESLKQQMNLSELYDVETAIADICLENNHLDSAEALYTELLDSKIILNRAPIECSLICLSVKKSDLATFGIKYKAFVDKYYDNVEYYDYILNIANTLKSMKYNNEAYGIYDDIISNSKDKKLILESYKNIAEIEISFKNVYKAEGFISSIQALYGNTEELAEIETIVGQAYIELHYPEKAEALFNNVIQDYPESEHAIRSLKNRISSELQNGNVDLAKSDIELLLSWPAKEVSADLIYRLGIELADKNYKDDGEKCLNYVIDNFSKSKPARWSLGHMAKIAIREGNINKAMELIAKLPDKCVTNDEWVDELNYQSKELIKYKFYNEAKKVDLINLEINSDNIEASRRIIKSEIALGNKDVANSLVEKLTIDYEEHFELGNIIVSIGEVFKEFGYFQEANEIYNSVVISYSQSECAVRALKNRISLELQNGIVNTAKADVKLLLSWPAKEVTAEALYRLGMELIDKNLKDEGMACLNNVIDNFTQNVNSRWALGFMAKLSIREGNIDRAMELIAKLPEKCVTNEDWIGELNYQSQELFDYGYYNESIQVDSINLEINSDNINASKRIIKSELALGNKDIADNLVKKLLLNYKGHSDLGKCISDLGDYCLNNLRNDKEAIKYYKAVYGNNLPNSMQCCKKHAIMLVNSGLYSDAIDLSLLVIPFCNDSSGSILCLFEIADKLGNYYPKKIEMFTRMLQIYNKPDVELEIRGKLICALVRNQNYATADQYLKDLEQQIDLFNADKAAEILTSIGDAYKECHYFEKAKSIFDNVIKSYPESDYSILSLEKRISTELQEGSSSIVNGYLNLLMSWPIRNVTAESLYRLGREFGDKDYNTESKKCFNFVINNFDRNIHARWSVGHMAKMAIRGRDIQRAVELIARLPEKCQNDAEYSDELNYQANELYDHGYYNELVELFEDIATKESNPSLLIAANKNLIRAYIRLDNIDEAKKCAGRILALIENNNESTNNVLQAADLLQDIESDTECIDYANKLYRHIVAKCAKSDEAPRAIVELIRIGSRNGITDDILRLVDQLVLNKELNLHYTDVISDLSEIFIKNGQYDESIYLNEYLLKNITDSNQKNMLTGSNIIARIYHEAETAGGNLDIFHIWDEYPEMLNELANLGEYLYDTKRYPECRIVYQHVIDLTIDRPENNNHARASIGLKILDFEATTDSETRKLILKDLIVNNKNHKDLTLTALNILAYVPYSEAKEYSRSDTVNFGLLKARKSYQASIDVFKTIIETYPDTNNAYNGMVSIGLIYGKELKDYEQAVDTLEAAVATQRKYPDLSKAYYLLERYMTNLADEGGIDKEISSVRCDDLRNVILTEFPDSIYAFDINYKLGNDAYMTERWEDAMRYLEPLSLSKHDTQKIFPEILYKLGKCYEIQGDNDMAVILYERCLNDYPNSSSRIKYFVKQRLISLNPDSELLQ